jgi:hypothetical protein
MVNNGIYLIRKYFSRLSAHFVMALSNNNKDNLYIIACGIHRQPLFRTDFIPFSYDLVGNLPFIEDSFVSWGNCSLDCEEYLKYTKKERKWILHD